MNPNGNEMSQAIKRVTSLAVVPKTDMSRASAFSDAVIHVRTGTTHSEGQAARDGCINEATTRMAQTPVKMAQAGTRNSTSAGTGRRLSSAAFIERLPPERAPRSFWGG